MSTEECLHGDVPADCAICGATDSAGRGPGPDRVGYDKWLVSCPAITDDSLLHFNRQGDSYRLRAYVGRLAGRREWRQPDAPTTADFLRLYRLQHRIDVAPEQLSVEETARWADITARHNARLGIGTHPSA